MNKGRQTPRLTPALMTCIAAYLIAIPLAFVQVRLSVIPLALFLLVCFAAPFFPGYGFYLPVISKGRAGGRAVALTFDDGPDPATTPALLEVLKRYEAIATFFVIGERAAAHPGLIRLILSGGHSIGNHSYHHSPLLMLCPVFRLRAEIQATRELLSEFGISACAFRPPVGITSPRLGPVLAEMGLICVNFNRRGFDAGNRRLRRLSEKILKKVKPGDIMLLHDRLPAGSTDAGPLFEEVERILSGLREKKMPVLPLSELTGATIMEKLRKPSP